MAAKDAAISFPLSPLAGWGPGPSGASCDRRPAPRNLLVLHVFCVGKPSSGYHFRGLSMRCIVSIIFLLLFSVAAYAGAMEVRPSEPVAEFTIPDDWTTSRIDRGIEAISKDEEVYFWIESYKPAEFQQLIAEHNAYWKEQGVAITSSDEQKHQENGREVIITTEHATWKGGPTVLYYVEFHLGLPSHSNIVLTYWASPEGDKTFHRQVGDVLASLKVTEK